MSIDEETRRRRWRLMIGQDADAGCGAATGAIREMDQVLSALYDSDRSAGLGSSSPNVHRWLGDIRRYFPAPIVRVMQKDALDRLGLRQMLFEPEMLEQIEPDVHLVATLLSLRHVIPKKTKETARQVVRKTVAELEKRLRNPLVQAVRGAIHRAARTNRPRPREIDWDRTIKKNIKNYLPDRKTIIVDRLVGFGHKRSSLRDVILCVDQSGSMATSVVYSGIFAAVLASISALKTRMVVFDTAVVDLTEHMQDPVDLLFGTQLGGGTDINRALAYCQQHLRQPSKTILVLISDLFEGGDAKEMLSRVAAMRAAGVRVVSLLALNDDGAPCFDQQHAAQFAQLGAPAFACTPDLFPDLMAAAIRNDDLGQWAARQGIVTAGREPG